MPLEGSPVPCGAVVSTIASQQDGSLFESPGALPGFSWGTLTSSHSLSTCILGRGELATLNHPLLSALMVLCFSGPK